MKWVKFQKLKKEKKLVYLPKEMAKKIKSEIKLRFGLRETDVLVRPINIEKEEGLNAFNNPTHIGCSQKVMEELLIKDSVTYQIFYKDNTLYIGPVIGILLGDQYYCYHDRYMQEVTDGMGIYEQVGGLMVAFKISNIEWEKAKSLECILIMILKHGSMANFHFLQ